MDEVKLLPYSIVVSVAAIALLVSLVTLGLGVAFKSGELCLWASAVGAYVAAFSFFHANKYR